MFKKTLICLAVASSVALTGCLGGNGTGKNAGVQSTVTSNTYDNASYPEFNVVKGGPLPIPNDLMFAGSVDGTMVASGDAANNPVIAALNQISGASTNAPIDIPIKGSIDPSSVDARSFIQNPQDPSNPADQIPNPNQNVFLIKYVYASGNPVGALNPNSPNYGEPPTLPSNPADFPSYTAKVLNLNGKTVLRILPTKPLAAGTRYEVVLTNGIKDSSDKPLIPSPSYSDLVSGKADASQSLIQVTDLIDKLWQPVAENYVTNVTDQSLPQTPITAQQFQQKIVLSYSFTTSDDQQVLQDIADPTQWLYGTIKQQVDDQTVKSVLASNPNADEGTIATAITSAEQAYTNSAVGCNSTPNGIACTAQALYGAIGASAFPTPQAVGSTSAPIAFTPVQPSITTTTGSTATSMPLPSNAAAFQSAYIDQIYKDMPSLYSNNSGVPYTVDVVQGTMQIPYYMGKPIGSDGTAITADSWQADDGLAKTINTVLGLGDSGYPQADPSKSTKVNYIYPFPKKRGDVTIPVLAMYPDGALTNNSTNSLTTVIFQHGITTDRSSALTIGSAIIQAYKNATGKNLAIVAIDQPLHGVVETNTQDEDNEAASLLGYTPASLTSAQQAKVDAVVNGSYLVGALGQIQSACPAIQGTGYDLTTPSGVQNAIGTIFGGGCNSSVPTAISTVTGAIAIENSAQHPGSIVPGLAHTANERTFDFTQDPSTGAAIPQSASEGKTLNHSGSLFINLANFANNRDNLREAVLDLLTLRKSIGNLDLNNDGFPDLNANDVYFIGHSLGAIDGGVFAAIANNNNYHLSPGSTNPNTVLKGVDLIAPGGGIVRLLDNSPSFASAILTGLASNGLTEGDADLETYFDIYQATIDAGDPINFVNDWINNQQPMLLTEFTGDQTIPNLPYAVSDPSTLGCYLSGQTSASLCGYTLNGLPEQGAPLSGTEPLLTNSGAANMTASTSAAFSSSQPVWDVRFSKGTHGTPVMYTNSDQAEAFAELAAEAASMIAHGGTGVTVNDGNTVKSNY